MEFATELLVLTSSVLTMAATTVPLLKKSTRIANSDNLPSKERF